SSRRRCRSALARSQQCRRPISARRRKFVRTTLARSVVDDVRRLFAEPDALRQALEEQIAEAASACPVGPNCPIVPQGSGRTLGQNLQWQRRVRATYSPGDFSHDLAAEVAPARRATWSLCLRPGATQEDIHEIGFANLPVSDRHVGCRREVIGEYDRTPSM